MSKTWILLFTAVVSACADTQIESQVSEGQVVPSACDWTQVFGTPGHNGKACAAPLTGMTVEKVIVQDADAARQVDDWGFLRNHESSPLTWQDWVFIPGSTDYRFDPRGTGPTFRVVTHNRHVQAYRRIPGRGLVPQWKIGSDWQGVDSILFGYQLSSNYRPQFQPAIAGDDLWMPIARGAVARVDIATGHVEATYAPFAGTPFDVDGTFVNNALSTSPDGSIWYTVNSIRSIDFDTEPVGSWVVRISPSGAITTRPWSEIATASLGVPQEHDQCSFGFFRGEQHDASTPVPTAECGPPRAAMNVPVSFRPDGSAILLSVNHDIRRSEHLIELDPSGTPVASADTRGHLLTGCGVRIGGRRCIGQPLGFDPDYNEPVAFIGADLMDGAPSIDPDGGVSISGYDNGVTFGGGFDARGSILRFGVREPGSHSLPLIGKNEAYGWEVTPTSPLRPDGTWSFYQDFQLYSDFDLRIGKLDRNFVGEAFGTITLDENANAIDWLDAHIPVDTAGNFYASNGMGVLVKFAPDGTAIGHVILTDPATGERLSIETLSGYYAWATDGTLYASYGGNVYAIRSGDGPDVPPPALAPSAALKAGLAAKRAAMAAVGRGSER